MRNLLGTHRERMEMYTEKSTQKIALRSRQSLKKPTRETPQESRNDALGTNGETNTEACIWSLIQLQEDDVLNYPKEVKNFKSLLSNLLSKSNGVSCTVKKNKVF